MELIFIQLRGASMRITFNVQGVGLGNNGGSLTLIHSANTLQKLGCEVRIISTVGNKCTWAKLECEHIVERNNFYPNAEILVATGLNSVSRVVEAHPKRGAKVHWIRGYERWVWGARHPNTYKLYRAPLTRIVNSVGLQQYFLNKFGEAPPVIRPGMDFDKFKPNGKRGFARRTIILGALYSGNKRKRLTKRFEWAQAAYRELYDSGKNVRLILYGEAPMAMVTIPRMEYYSQPTVEQLEELYNQIDLWMAPTELEGLHIPPQEAMLCGCPVIGTMAPLSGMGDYLAHRGTGFVTINRRDKFIEGVRKIVTNHKLRKELSERGREKILELGSREDNMRQFIRLAQRIGMRR